MNSGKIKHVARDYKKLTHSVFDRRNKRSMDLFPLNSKKRFFRFTTVKLQFSLKNRLWVHLTTILKRIRNFKKKFKRLRV